MLLPIHTKERNNFHGTEKLTFRWQIKNQGTKTFCEGKQRNMKKKLLESEHANSATDQPRKGPNSEKNTKEN